MPVKTKKAKTPAKELTGVQDLYHFLYKACDILRKFVEHESFKDYITPLLYYKRLSDVWDEEYEAALAESGNDEEYARLPEQHRFVIPKECHWEEVRARQSDGVFACDATTEEIAANNFSLAISLYAHAASIRSSECGARNLDDAIEEWNRAANQTVDALDDFKLLVEGR